MAKSKQWPTSAATSRHARHITWNCEQKTGTEEISTLGAKKKKVRKAFSQGLEILIFLIFFSSMNDKRKRRGSLL